ncbi:MAG: SymE family type I addiction module toxin [Thermoanaerobaculia bacterium]
MRSRLAATLQQLPVLARPRRRRVRAVKRATTRAAERTRKPRPWRSPHVLTMTMRLVPRSTMEEARVPYLRMSGRWLAAHGFKIGERVYVTVEQGRVILTNTPPAAGATLG